MVLVLQWFGQLIPAPNPPKCSAPVERLRQLRASPFLRANSRALVWVEGQLASVSRQPDARLHETDPPGVCRDDAKLVAGYLADCDDFSVGSVSAPAAENSGVKAHRSQRAVRESSVPATSKARPVLREQTDLRLLTIEWCSIGLKVPRSLG